MGRQCQKLPGANTRRAGHSKKHENLKESVALVIEANRELTLLEIMGDDIIREELLVAA